jgi:hypothetical protein
MGQSVDEVVTDLVAHGMSEATARRLVDKAAASPLPQAAESPAAQTERQDNSDPSGTYALIRGAFFFSLGLALTIVSYALAKPGEKYVITYGLVVAGIAAVVHGWRRWSQSGMPFPAGSFTAALLFPLLAGGIAIWLSREPTAEEHRQQAEQQKRQVEEDAMAKRVSTWQEKTQAIIGAQNKLTYSPEPSERCEAAHYLGGTDKQSAVHVLEGVLARDPDMNVRRCIVDSLISLGHPDPIVYGMRDWAKYDGHRSVLVYGLEKLKDDPSEKIREQAAIRLAQLEE